MLVHGASGGVRHVLSLHGCHIYNRPQTKLRKSIFYRCLSVREGELGISCPVSFPWVAGYVQRGTHSLPWRGGYSPTPIQGTWDTTGYSRQAGGTHPSGMLSY